jgi:hypothetical protein
MLKQFLEALIDGRKIYIRSIVPADSRQIFIDTLERVQE